MKQFAITKSKIIINVFTIPMFCCKTEPNSTCPNEKKSNLELV
jgi:hypothetical protein